MKVVVIGSTGNIGKHLTTKLVENLHQVIGIGHRPENKQQIEDIGAKAAIGRIEDAKFLAKTFEGADVVFTMMPPVDFFDHNMNIDTHWLNIARSYVEAIKVSGVKKVIYMSSVGAHMETGNGLMINTQYQVEKLLSQLATDVSIKFIRPVGFYINLYGFLPTINTDGAIYQNYEDNLKEPWVSPFDISTTIFEEIEKPFEGRSVQYVASDLATPNEVVKVLGDAIGKPDLKWITITDEQLQDALTGIGFNPTTAKAFVDMNKGRRNHIYDDFFKQKITYGKTKLKDFAEEFAVVYSQQKNN